MSLTEDFSDTFILRWQNKHYGKEIHAHLYTKDSVSVGIVATATSVILANVLQILDALDYCRTVLENELCYRGLENGSLQWVENGVKNSV